MNPLLKTVLELHGLTLLPDVIVIADTSGSMDEDTMNRLLQHIQGIAGILDIPLLVLYVDYKYQGCQLIETGKPIELFPAGGGGTDYRAGFGYIDEQDFQPDLVLYLTDGLCPFFPEEPKYQVIWIQFGDEYFEPPFGTKFQMSNN